MSRKRLSSSRKNLVIRGDEREIAIVLQDPARYKVIIAPPGSGKSHAIVLSIVPFLDSRSGNSDKFVIICSSKDQMIQFAQRFSAVLGSDNINAQGIDLIEATGSIKVGQAKSRDAVRKSTRVAITHNTYVSRRRFSQYYYAFLKFIDENTHVHIDELDAYIESQTTHYPLGSRKRHIAKDGRIKNIHVSKCGMFHNYNNCTNCIMHKYDGNRMDVDDYRNLGYVPVSEFMEGTRLESLEHIDLESRTVATVCIRTTEVSMLKQCEDPGEIQFDDDGVMADFKSIFEDHLNSAYLPTVHRSVILYDGQEISRMDFIERFRLNQDSRVTDIQDKERAKLRFPSRACNVLTVTMIDRRPLLWMSRAKSLTGLTATISPLQERFLQDQLGEIKRFEIAPKEDRKIDKILVIGLESEIPLRLYIEGHLKFNKMLRYRETQRAAEHDFEVLRNSDIPIRMGYDKRKFMLSSDEHEYGQHKILQTYAFSTLGRGIDFAAYDLVDLNADIYKPISAYVTDDPETLHAMILEDRANQIIQNVGRILRRVKGVDHAVKIVILERLEEEKELEAVAQRLAEMSIETVDTWWVPNFLAMEEVCEHISRTVHDKALPQDVPRSYKILIERAEKLISEGCGKTEIKKALRWATVRKKLLPEQAREVEEAIDRRLETRVQDSDRRLTPKDLKRRERRLEKINALRAEGKTVGQIRSYMGVYSGKRPWAKSEQDWFEQMVNQGS